MKLRLWKSQLVVFVKVAEEAQIELSLDYTPLGRMELSDWLVSSLGWGSIIAVRE